MDCSNRFRILGQHKPRFEWSRTPMTLTTKNKALRRPFCCADSAKRSFQNRGAVLKALRTWISVSLAIASMSIVMHGQTIFVSATAPAGGNGSEHAPFNSLADVERASAPGDEIIVLASPITAAPLDGGIALKAHQKLTGRGPSVAGGTTFEQAARITNSSDASHSGDAVVLGDFTEVSNLMIVNAYRGGIYGQNVTGAKIHDNNLTGTNVSCTPGFFVIFPVNVELLPNGWAAIMVDEDNGTRSISIEHNYIHDGTCNDGIDLRATGTAQVMANVDANNITHLAQGPKMRSLLGLGMQTRDTAMMTVESDHNSETYIGSPNADCEGLFTNQTGGILTWNIRNNTFAHGIGGASCNGGEFFPTGGDATTNLYIGHSTFEDNPGDMIEEVNEGKGTTMHLILDDVTISHVTQAKPIVPEPRFSDGTDNNLSRCIDIGSHGHQNVTYFEMINSRVFDCAGDGIGSIVNTRGSRAMPPSPGRGNAITTDYGDGVGDSIWMDIRNSSISGTPQYAFHFTNQTEMGELHIKVENTKFSDAKGLAVVAFDQKGTTQHSDIDLGSEEPHSKGQNCITGATNLALEITGYDVSAKSNWWGRPEGPLPAKISVTDGNVNFMPALRVAPPACKETK
jgi:hypothetical protein